MGFKELFGRFSAMFNKKEIQINPRIERFHRMRKDVLIALLLLIMLNHPSMWVQILKYDKIALELS